MKRLLVVTTGGTLDALPYTNPSRHPPYSVFPSLGACQVRRALMRPDMALRAQTCRWAALPPRDSKRIDAAYRAKIRRAMARHSVPRVLIAHGTDTLLTTAAYLHRLKGTRSKTVVLVGAMLPLANGAVSDGWQNLRYAVRRLTRQGTLPPGIYLVLSDYVGPQRVWLPRLYRFMPGALEKYYDPDRADRSRLLVHDRRALV